LHWVLLSQKKNAQQNAALRWYIPQGRSSFWLPKPASGHANARLLARLFYVEKNSCIYKNWLDNSHPALLAVVSTVILGFEPHGTHHILLSDGSRSLRTLQAVELFWSFYIYTVPTKEYTWNAFQSVKQSYFVTDHYRFHISRLC
jgi:hypothetical protein